MKFGKFKGKIPFLKRNKEAGSEIETEPVEAQAEVPMEDLEPQEEEGAPGESNENGPEDQPAPSSEVPSTGENTEPAAKTSGEKGKSGEPQSEKKDGAKASALMDELLKEITSQDSNPIHLLAQSLDDVDINYLLTEGRTLAVRLKRRTGKLK